MKRLLFPLMAMTAAGCSTVNSEPDVRTTSADGIFAVRLGADSSPTLVYVADGKVSWGADSLSASGSVHAWAAGGAPAGPGEMLLIGLGRSRSSPKATPTLITINASGASTIDVSKYGSRITDISIQAGQALVTILGPEKSATSYALQDGGLIRRNTSLMGLQQVGLSDSGLTAIGRLYGAEPRSHGGLDLVESGVVISTPPGIRGVRTLAVADIDHDGSDDLLVADGWHFRYGHDAQALVSVYPGPDFRERVPIGEIEDSYTINSLDYVMSPSGGSVIALGSHSLVQFRKTNLGWKQTRLSDANEQSTASVWATTPNWLNSAPDPWLILSGKDPKAIKIP